MTTEKIYSQILAILATMKEDEAVQYWDTMNSKQHLDGKFLRSTNIFTGETGTLLYALKCDLEEDLQAEQAKKNGRKNLSAVKAFMKKAREQEFKEEIQYAHEIDGKFFVMTPYQFYITEHKEGLIFAPAEKEEEWNVSSFYKTICNFKTDGKTIEIPYTVSQLKAWKKATKSEVFALGYSYQVCGETYYMCVKTDFLIQAMQITGSQTLLTDNNYNLAMENADGDRFGMCAIRRTTENFKDFQKI